MYNVIFKVNVEVWDNLFICGRDRRANTFNKYLRKKIKGYHRTNKIYNPKDSKFYESFYMIKEVSLEEDNIEAYNNLVYSFKTLVDGEYTRISKYAKGTDVMGYMCVYNKGYFNKNKNAHKHVHDIYVDNSNAMPDYDTILQYHSEVKAYDPETGIMKSYFDRYDFVYEELCCDKSLTIADVCDHSVSSSYFGREELINGFHPKYKVGDIVDYDNGKIAIIRSVPEASEGCGGNYIDTIYDIDYLTYNRYTWFDYGHDIRECDFKPYTGEVPEFIKLLQKAVLEQDGYKLPQHARYEFDTIVEYKDVVEDFDNFKDELIEILTA